MYNVFVYRMAICSLEVDCSDFLLKEHQSSTLPCTPYRCYGKDVQTTSVTLICIESYLAVPLEGILDWGS